LGSQDTFSVGTLKGIGRVHQQTYIDTYSKVAQVNLYTAKAPITAADLLNDRVLPFHEEHNLPMLRIMTDRGLTIAAVSTDMTSNSSWQSTILITQRPR